MLVHLQIKFGPTQMQWWRVLQNKQAPVTKNKQKQLENPPPSQRWETRTEAPDEESNDDRNDDQDDQDDKKAGDLKHVANGKYEPDKVE